MQRIRLQRRIAILLCDVTLERLRRCVQQIPFESADWPLGDHALVYRIVAPPRAAPVEQAGNPVGVALAVRQPAAEKTVAARKRIRGMRWLARGEERADRLAQRRRQALVGVEAEHPVMARLLHCELL